MPKYHKKIRIGFYLIITWMSRQKNRLFHPLGSLKVLICGKQKSTIMIFVLEPKQLYKIQQKHSREPNSTG